MPSGRSLLADLYLRVRGCCSSGRAKSQYKKASQLPAGQSGRGHRMGTPEVSSVPQQAAVNEDAAPAEEKVPEPSAAAKRRAELCRAHLELQNVAAENDAKGGPQVAVVYDEAMELHCGPEKHPEQPGRIRQVVAQMQLAGLLDVCERLQAREAVASELEFVHTANHVERVFHGMGQGARKKAKAYSFPFGPDTYVCEHTPQAARLAAGCPLQLVDSAFDPVESRPRSGVAVVRPPGHHATQDKASGFCLFNNIAVAARYAQRRYNIQRIAIIDWDVHHGNGTNDIFQDDTSILFFSMHRWDSQGFFPGTGSADELGHGDAKGYTVNVPMEKGFADVDVCHVVKYVLCPMIQSFEPELILVSAGFDAVKGDPLGECKMSPEGFGWFTRCLHRLAKHHCHGRLLLLLEGGYNPDLIAQCTVECLRALVTEASSTPSQFLSSELTLPDTPLATSVPASSMPSSGQSTPVTASPSASPVMRSVAPDMPLAASPLLTRQTSDSSAPSSPKGRSTAYTDHNKHRGPSVKTVKTVRRITEMHQLLGLELPLAPKQADGGGSEMEGAKAARKAERRRQHRQRVGSDDVEGEASSDSSGWAIACGSEDEAPWPPASPAATFRRSPNQAAVVLSGSEPLGHENFDFELLELPPSADADTEGQDVEEESARQNAPSGTSKRSGKNRASATSPPASPSTGARSPDAAIELAGSAEDGQHSKGALAARAVKGRKSKGGKNRK